MQVHLLEGEAEEREHGIRAEATAPVLLVADHDAEFGMAVLGVGAVQAAVADVYALFRFDGEARVGEVEWLSCALDPVAFGLEGEGVARHQVARHLAVVHPAEGVLGVLGLDGP